MRADYINQVLPPLVFDDTAADYAEEFWTHETDVLVLGWGASGACTALEAISHGLRVTVADRFMGGGASAKSGGVVYAGGGTAQQQLAGFSDSVQSMYDYLKQETHGVIADETLMRFCRNSATNLRWLEDHGVPFASSVPPSGKTSYPTDAYYLYYSGNELVPAYGAPNSAPRGHRTYSKGQAGKTLYRHLQQACLAQGVQALTQARVTRLITDRWGQVIGAELWQLPAQSKAARRHRILAARAERLQNFAPLYCQRLRNRLAAIEASHSQPIRVRAQRGVVLCTGGFIFNPTLVNEHAGSYRRNFKIGATGCDGSGLRLGQSVGANSQKLNTVSAWRFINPPLCWPNGIVVNSRGERFCNEEVYGATLGHAICEDQGGKAWLILDKPLRRKALRQALFGGYWWFQSLPALALMTFGAITARTPGELAAKLKMDSSALAHAIDSYDLPQFSGGGDPLGKSAASCTPLTQGPYYALDISVKSPIFPLGSLTLGGLEVDEDTGQVLNEHGLAIAGLYAAGRTAVGIPSNLYISGLSLADCVFSGRRAGAAVAGARSMA
ncbi:FAD-binding protein [Shewanella sp. GXUN23E]|uniref:FAD-binding protein n=1 Tax=Shewanella sp. GXUN23E TaxID=3422498 RepID=UPI003D7DCCDD